MHFSWRIMAIALIINLFCMGAMYWAQWIDKGLPARGSIISGTNQKFLYVQDFYTCTWGDLIGVTLIIANFGHLMAYGFIGPWQWFAGIIITIIAGWYFLNMCLKSSHKPDQGYPCTGEVSLHGLLYLPYFGACIAMTALDIVHIFAGNMEGIFSQLLLFGFVFYAICFGKDIMAGHFDPLETESGKKPQGSQQKGMCYEEQ